MPRKLKTIKKFKINSYLNPDKTTRTDFLDFPISLANHLN